LPAKRLNPERLRDKVREAMTRTDGAKRIAAAFAAAGGAAAAVDAVERRLIASGVPGTERPER
jgi:UDP:flavonoid glycosyltransferase YjiC (YdhE family)